MKTTSLLSILFSALAVAHPLAASPPSPPSDGCFVTQELRSTLSGTFTLQLQPHPFHTSTSPAPSPSPAWTSAQPSFVKSADGWEYGVHAKGAKMRLTLTDGVLANEKRGVAVTLEPRGRPRWLRVAFSKNTANEHRGVYQAQRMCIGGKGVTTVGPNEGRVFCVVADERRKGDWTLWTKPSDQEDECVVVAAVVKMA
ncbi:hypothetical protein BZA05DRAFT_453497 [Tricharina praecox]|uniref:uncharacterized protein n=1 Tax=Tricharina praecox TaxID=43433 RepID=UPI00221FD18E|nr:uncharacterized protein BZA05DRAFT_453497 [Tricharina praecox]KAI5850943.1 hypothetical protein BZA05DRAFT_453497 [Tricharina praecox]